MQPGFNLQKYSYIHNITKKIILPLFLSNVLIRLLDLMKDITQYIFILNFQAELHSDKFLLKISHLRTKYQNNPRNLSMEGPLATFLSQDKSKGEWSEAIRFRCVTQKSEKKLYQWVLLTTLSSCLQV